VGAAEDAQRVDEPLVEVIEVDPMERLLDLLTNVDDESVIEIGALDRDESDAKVAVLIEAELWAVLDD
jgi:hypothetical protein